MAFPTLHPRWRSALIVVVLAVLIPLTGKALLHHTAQAREERLMEALTLLRNALHQYHDDVGHYPQQLDALVKARYLRQLPKDPMTDSHDAWLLVRADDNGIANILSSASGRSQNGTLYQHW